MILTAQEVAQMQAQASAEYPYECCGFVLVRDRGTPNRLIFPCRNVQNELHAKDPARYQRDARTAYHIHDEDLRTVFGPLDRDGYRIAVIYHSHIDVGAYFSQTDKEQALMNGEPAYPDAAYVVVSVVERTVQALGAFQWDPSRRDFAPVEITIT
ncbi:MAG TPA: Mov34/MPN/PAD-1 family protein [Methylomirabilota bacterium]|nr:Mov34/MPN/PAD-1 family protein [Methylomirabilota bacterium]